MPEQRRGRSIAMTDAELDEFLRSRPVCRVASIGPGGAPHTSALWFVWDGEALWLYSITRSQRWTDITRDPRVSVIIDDGGADFRALCGVELRGSVEAVGEAPRTGETVAELTAPERLFAEKYSEGREFRYDGRHAWLRLRPKTRISWDFSKMRTG